LLSPFPLLALELHREGEPAGGLRFSVFCVHSRTVEDGTGRDNAYRPKRAQKDSGKDHGRVI